MTQGLQHILQLLLIHRHRQVGDVQVSGVLLLLLRGREAEGQVGSEVGVDRGEGREKEKKRGEIMHHQLLHGIAKYASALCQETSRDMSQCCQQWTKTLGELT